MAFISAKRHHTASASGGRGSQFISADQSVSASGQGTLFGGAHGYATYLSASSSDDLPPYATIVIVGHVVVPLFFWFDRTFTLPLWIQFATWLPLTALLTIGLLPFVKGGVIGLCWATGTVRPDAS
jgi:hypothetical protein